MIKRWFRNWWTAHMIRLTLQYGYCPMCKSSPPDQDCKICRGTYAYGPKVNTAQRGLWADFYIRARAK